MGLRPDQQAAHSSEITDSDSPDTIKSHVREISEFYLFYIRNTMYTSICFLQCFLVIGSVILVLMTVFLGG